MRLAGVATYIPGNRIAVQDCVASAGGTALESKAFSRLFGIEKVAALSPDTEMEEIVSTLLDDLQGGIDQAATLPDVVISVHGIPRHEGMLARAIMGLRAANSCLANVGSFYEMDQQNCSTLFWALDAAQRLISSGEASCVLVIAGDSLAEMPMRERYAPGCTAIGDAFAALLLDGRPGGWRVRNIGLDTRSAFHAGRFGAPGDVSAFNGAHTGLVNEILGWLGHDVSGPEPLLAHNVNRLSWSKFAKDTQSGRGHVWLDLLPDIGHCYTLDPFMMLPRLFASDHQSAALLSVGQGGFLAGCRVTGPFRSTEERHDFV